MSRLGAFLLTTTLFLGDLSVLCNEMNVRELLGRYGELERVQLKKSDRDPHRAHLGFGFVKFASRASAERALEELNGSFFMGRALRVGWADDYNRIRSEMKTRDPKKNRATAQLHVSFSSDDSSRMVSEMELGLVFGVFGNVVDIAIKRNVLKKKSGMQAGYAFVHFALTLRGLESAFSAAEQVNNKTIDQIRYKCNTDQALLMQYLSLKSCDGSESCNTKASKVKIASTPDPIPVSLLAHHDGWGYGIKSHREPYCQIDGTYNPVVPSLTHTLHFSTYGNNVEAERSYSSPTSLHGRFSCIRREQRFIDKSVMHNESTSMMRSFSSAKENDFLQPSEIISS